MGKKTAPAGGGGSPMKKKKLQEVVAVPSVFDLGPLAAAAGSIPRPSFDGGITIELFRYCTCASVYSESFGQGGLEVLGMACGDQPNPLFYFTKVLELYGASTQGTPTPEPTTREGIQEEYFARFEFVSKKTMEQDQDKVGWRKYGLAAYVWGGPQAVKEFLMYIDNVIDWRTTLEESPFEPLASKPKITIHVPADYPLELDATADELKCSFELKKGASGKLTVFDIPPPTFPSRIVIATFELVSDTTAHVIFSGNTKPFQSGFGNLKIRGTSLKLKPTDAYAEFFRVREPAYDLSKKEECVRELKSILGNGCLKSSPVIVRLKNQKKYETEAMLAVIEELKECENVRFDV